MAIQFLLPNDLKCIAGLFCEKNPRITDHHRLLTNKMPDGILRFNLQYSVLNTILYLGHKSFNNNKIIYSPWKHCDGKIFYLCKAGSAWGDQGTESLWLDSQLSVVDVPSRDRSPEGNRGE